MIAPQVDVVIVAYGSEDLIGECVASVAALAEVGSVIVVDNGDGRSADVASGVGAIGVRRPDNPGFGAGQNEGANRATAEFVLLLNPDAVMEPGALAAGLRAFGDPTVAAAQGVVASSATGKPERSAGRELGPLHLAGRAFGARHLLAKPTVARLVRLLPMLRDHVDRAPTRALEVESLAAVSILVRRSALSDVGGFDERYFLYGEDLDLCRRLRSRSWRLLALPVPWSRHRSGASTDGWWDRELRWWEGTMQFAAQWWSGPSFVLGLASATVMWVRMAVVKPSGVLGSAVALLIRPLELRLQRGRVNRSIRRL